MDPGHCLGAPVMCVTNFVWEQSDILHARARHDQCVTNKCAVVKVNAPISHSPCSWNILECKTRSFVADQCILGIAWTCHLHRLWKHPFAKLDERGSDWIDVGTGCQQPASSLLSFLPSPGSYVTLQWKQGRGGNKQAISFTSVSTATQPLSSL